MKNLTLFLLTLFIPILLDAQIQGQEYIYSQIEWATTNTGIKIGDNVYFGGSDFLCKNAMVTCVGPNDNLIFRTSLESGYWEVGDIIYQENENRILGCGFYSSSDDFPDGNLGPTVFAMDLNGNLLFQTILDENTFGQLGNHNTEVTYTINGDIVMATKDKLLWFDESGAYQSAQTISSEPDILGIKRVNDDELLAYSESKLYTMDHEGLVLQTITVGLGTINSLFVSNNITYALTANGLFHYSSVDQSTGNHTGFLSAISIPTGICGNADKLFIYEKSNPDVDYEKILMLNKNSFAVEEEFFFEQPEVVIREVVSSDNELLFVGTYTMSEENLNSPMYPYILGQQSFVKTTPIFDAPLFSSADISVSNLEITNPLVPVDTIEDYPGTFWIWFDSPYVGFNFDITNDGTEPIYSFSITSNSFWNFNCAEARYFRHFENITIFPGETMTFSDSSWVIDHMPVGANEPKLSLTCTAPNHRFDGDYSNNYVIQFLIWVGVDEPLLVDKLSISPNPATNYIQLNAELTNALDKVLLELFDPLGKKHVQQEVSSGNNQIDAHLYVGDLASGLYFMQLSANGKRHVERVVIH